jgi:hypothetical protein
VPESRIKFAGLRNLLLDSGFRDVTISATHIGFQHDQSATLIVLPEYALNADVASHQLAQVRVTLDAKGLLNAREFDGRLAGALAKHPATS